MLFGLFYTFQIILFYLKLLQAQNSSTVHIFDTNFYKNLREGKFETVKSWTKQVCSQYNIVMF